MEYLNYNKIKNFNTGPIAVHCYFNTQWWVCPNPRDEGRSYALRKQYNDGWYIKVVTVRMTEEQFADPENWNS